MKPRRYQLRRTAVDVVNRGHPWIFRDQLSSAANVFRDGDWLALVDGANQLIGYGMYQAEGAIAIRILRLGSRPPDAAWVIATVVTALARREALAKDTDGLRLINGESDGLSAIVVDRFGSALVVSSYARGADAIARYLASWLPRHRAALPRAIVGELACVMVRPAHRRRGPVEVPRIVQGEAPAIAHFTEDGLTFAVDLAHGHKTGAYLDLRGLRRAIRRAPLQGARVLNLFAYTGMLGRVAEVAGATQILQVDSSREALAWGQAHHVVDRAKHTWIRSDVFASLPELSAQLGPEPFDLVVVDPPAMTSVMAQVPAALASYRRLYSFARTLVRPGGALVAACCTSRIDRKAFHRVVRQALGPKFTFERELFAEPDHQAGFAQADYLKVGWWRRDTRTAPGLAPGQIGLITEPAGDN